jgi:hypothetical protein
MIQVFAHYICRSGKGGVGVLATHSPGDSFIRVYSEPCSDVDQYSKRIANTRLRMHVAEQQFIRIPLQRHLRWNASHRDVRDLVSNMFSDFLYWV